MDAADARLITDLAERIRAAGSPAKDPDAERLIFEQIGRQPDSLYVLVQAVLLQEQALRASQERISELERELEERVEPAPRRSFLDSLFGGGEPEPTTPRPAPAYAQQPPAAPAAGTGQTGPAPGAPAAAQQGGGFLRTAAAGALGVAGGALLASSISGMFANTGTQAQAQQPADAEPAGYDRSAQEQSTEDPGGWDQGGWDDGGGWDV